MTNASKIGQDAAGCLGSVPSRAGMSYLASKVALGQVLAGATVTVFDKGQSSEGMIASIENAKQEHYGRTLRVGRKRNDAAVAAPKNEPHYRQFDKRKF
ncbi:hypothetical protein [Azonexus hydrophilus]|uniref:Uncharacterized protein n=1 Tax=Azonexus hydrophilus TaxID=418702 RepID=A0ABZ2XM98_9RHOO